MSDHYGSDLQNPLCKSVLRMAVVLCFTGYAMGKTVFAKGNSGSGKKKPPWGKVST
ncbi:MAG TPA: hypothetical protein PKD52_02960 [Clostridiales bacterium]|nr:hypothetical protein [Clostridiales bacterium]